MSIQESASTANTALMEITVNSVTQDTTETQRKELLMTASSVLVPDLMSPTTLQLLVKSVTMDCLFHANVKQVTLNPCVTTVLLDIMENLMSWETLANHVNVTTTLIPRIQVLVIL